VTKRELIVRPIKNS